VSKQLSVRPSELLGLAKLGDYVCYCFDEAVTVFGSWVQSELDDLERGDKESKEAFKARMERHLDSLLNPADEVPKGQFADPAFLFQ
jgi:hypothetical protein